MGVGLALAATVLGCGTPAPTPIVVPVQESGRGAPLAIDPSPSAPAPLARAPQSFTWHACAAEGSLRSQVSEVTLDMELVNGTRESLSMIWLDFRGQRVEYAVLPAGTRYEQQTYVTHPWLVLGEDGRCLGIFVPNEAGKHVVRLARPPLTR